MYSDADLDGAVAAGVMPAAQAAAFRSYVAGGAGLARVAADRPDCESPDAEGGAADEEHFRLLTGFNDIFVSIAAMLVLIAVAWLCSHLGLAAAGASTAAVSWLFAEYFTRKRRMALPSILFLISFVTSAGVAGFGVFYSTSQALSGPSPNPWPIIVAFATAAVAAYAHWRRFMVPVTVAAGTAALLGTLMTLLVALMPGMRVAFQGLVFAAGLATFAIAMWWDASDTRRTTRRTDVAFWLHLVAAPMIVHPAFLALGLIGRGDAGAGHALVAIGLYLILAMVALAVDRRALLISALAYVLYAITALLRVTGSVNTGLALAGLVIGCGLLLLSALWHSVRFQVMRVVPQALRVYVPPV